MQFVTRLAIYTLLSCSAFSFCLAQTEQQVKRELEKRGIDTKTEVLQELSRRGMTEDDARRQARLYGIDYDDYLKKYILQSKDSTKAPRSIQGIGIDSTQYVEESQTKEDTVPNTNEVDDEITKKYYGYDIFEDNPFANDKSLIGNIDPGYIMGPGDELRIYLWGEAEMQFEGKIDINGNIFIPNVGQVFIAGTTYENLKDRMTRYLSRFYSGLTKEPQKIFLDISLTQLRPIRIVVMGESNNPGSQMVNAFATTLNSLYASGGIKTSGSLRDIKVFRNNRLVSSIDMYDYLNKGALSEDMRLMSNDVVFIPARMNEISITGEVNREMIFELKDNEGLFDLMAFAGGLKPSAYTKNITIRRIKSITTRNNDSNFDREIITVNYNELLNQGRNFKLQDGDEVVVNKVLDQLDNEVIIAGSVFRPGSYDLSKSKTIKDLIQLSGGIRPNTYFDKVDVYRKDDSGRLRFQSYDLSDILNDDITNNTALLQRNDSVRVYNLTDIQNVEKVTIDGYLDEPRSMVWREDLTVYDLIFMSAKVEDLEYKNRILTSRADIYRYQEGNTANQIIPFDLDEVLNKSYDILLKPKDRVVLYGKDINRELDQYVTIRGAVKKEGRFLLTDNMTVEDVILQAGGFVRTSFQDSITVTRERYDFTGNRIADAQRIAVDGQYLVGQVNEPNGSYFLKNNDQISVDYIPGSSEPREIKILGEIKYPGSYFLESKSEKLSSVLQRAGGVSPNARLNGAQFYRNGQRLSFSLEELVKNNRERDDIILQPEDSIYIPEYIYTVRVEGEVNNPAQQKYNSNKRVRDYLKDAGGKTKEGRKIFLTKPSGFTEKIGWFSNPKVDDGSIITVAAKPPKEPKEPGKFLENFGTISAIISSTLTTIFLIQRFDN